MSILREEEGLLTVFIKSVVFSFFVFAGFCLINYVLSMFGRCLTLSKVGGELVCKGASLRQIPIVVGIITFIFLFIPKFYKLILDPKIPSNLKPKKKINLQLRIVPEHYLARSLVWIVVLAIIALLLSIFLFGI